MLDGNSGDGGSGSNANNGGYYHNRDSISRARHASTIAIQTIILRVFSFFFNLFLTSGLIFRLRFFIYFLRLFPFCYFVRDVFFFVCCSQAKCCAHVKSSSFSHITAPPPLSSLLVIFPIFPIFPMFSFLQFYFLYQFSLDYASNCFHLFRTYRFSFAQVQHLYLSGKQNSEKKY